MGSCGHEKCQGDCCGDEPLILEGGATGVYGEWQERRGDYVIATVDLVGEFDNGVLSIHVPKEAQQERSQRIAIQVHAGSAQPTAVKAKESVTTAQPH